MGSSCSVCEKPLNEKNAIKFLCKHNLDAECAKKWCGEKFDCPICIKFSNDENINDQSPKESTSDELDDFKHQLGEIKLEDANLVNELGKQLKEFLQTEVKYNFFMAEYKFQKEKIEAQQRKISQNSTRLKDLKDIYDSILLTAEQQQLGKDDSEEDWQDNNKKNEVLQQSTDDKASHEIKNEEEDWKLKYEALLVNKRDTELRFIKTDEKIIQIMDDYFTLLEENLDTLEMKEVEASIYAEQLKVLRVVEGRRDRDKLRIETLQAMVFSATKYTIKQYNQSKKQLEQMKCKTNDERESESDTCRIKSDDESVTWSDSDNYQSGTHNPALS